MFFPTLHGFSGNVVIQKTPIYIPKYILSKKLICDIAVKEFNLSIKVSSVASATILKRFLTTIAEEIFWKIPFGTCFREDLYLKRF